MDEEFFNKLYLKKIKKLRLFQQQCQLNNNANFLNNENETFFASDSQMKSGKRLNLRNFKGSDVK
jgi:hypothetical protein